MLRTSSTFSSDIAYPPTLKGVGVPGFVEPILPKAEATTIRREPSDEAAGDGCGLAATRRANPELGSDAVAFDHRLSHSHAHITLLGRLLPQVLRQRGFTDDGFLRGMSNVDDVFAEQIDETGNVQACQQRP